MKRLTGNKDTDFIILMQLNDNELGLVCQVNKYVNSLCNDSMFWLNRIMANFPQYPFTGEEIRKMKEYLGFSTIRELYIYLKSIPEKISHSVYMTGNRMRTVTDTKKYIPIILKYLVEETFIDKIISDNLVENIPKWFNREELIYELRRKFPFSVFKENVERGNFVPKKIKSVGYWSRMKMDLCEIGKPQLFYYKNILH
jgi:hypothetical protein